MIALYIVGGLLLIAEVLLFLKLTFRVSWCMGLLLEVKIGFVTLRKEFRPLSAEVPEADTSEPKHTESKKKEPESGSVTLKQIVPIIKETLSFLLKKLKKHLRLEKYIVRINVATDDPAKTAILYGVISASAASLQTYIDTIKNAAGKKGRIFTEITPDFISEKTDVYVDISVSARVWQALSLLMTLAGGYKKYKILKTGKEE